MAAAPGPRPAATPIGPFQPRRYGGPGSNPPRPGKRSWRVPGSSVLPSWGPQIRQGRWGDASALQEGVHQIERLEQAIPLQHLLQAVVEPSGALLAFGVQPWAGSVVAGGQQGSADRGSELTLRFCFRAAQDVFVEGLRPVGAHQGAHHRAASSPPAPAM